MSLPSQSRSAVERSFESLYRRYAARVYRYAVGMLGSPADAEEVTQTAFLNAYRALERGERPRSPEAWLRTITLNLCRQRARQAARRGVEVPLSEHELAETVPDDHQPTLQDLTRALEHLPFNQRAALVMREFEGRSPREIAGALNLTIAAVETLLFRARRSLREQLDSTLSCHEAERAISRQLDGLLARGERAALRAHLRQCPDCARLARRLRAQRRTVKSLVLLPLPGSLLAWTPPAATVAAAGAGTASGLGTSLGGSLAAKLVAGTVAATLAAGVGYQALTQPPPRSLPSSRASHPYAVRTPGPRAVVAAGHGLARGTPQVQPSVAKHSALVSRRLEPGRPGTAAWSTPRPSSTVPSTASSPTSPPAKAANAKSPKLHKTKAMQTKTHPPKEVKVPKTKVANARKRKTAKDKPPKPAKL